ncbi:MAG: PAS domain-containing sensor histidine kinase [Spirochaetota bacterium]|nr:PAS domain-containing sensor histidine kinase [Spirochaetota bacterium]
MENENKIPKQKTLQEAHDKLSATLNALPDLLFEVDTKGCIHDFKSNNTEMLYLPPEHFLGKNISEVLPENASNVILDGINQAVKKGRHTGATYYLSMPDGIHWYELSIATMGDPKSPNLHLITLVRDITDRKQAEDSLKNTKDFLEKVMDNTTNAIYTIDISGKFVLINKRGLEIAGYPAEELIGENFSKLIPQNYLPIVNDEFLKIVNEGKTVSQFGTELIRKDGTTRYITFSGAPLMVENKITCMVGTAEDITELKKDEEALRKYNKELESLNAKLIESEKKLKESNITKDKFFSIVSHDIRTPLNYLIGFSDVLANNTAKLSQEKIIEFAKKINKSANNLLTLLENLLQWSRIQTGIEGFYPIKLNIYDLINENIELFTENIKDKKINLSLESNKNLKVFGDPHMLNFVIRNIISNAIKFTHIGGKINISSKKENKFIELSIQDNGVGISKDNLKNLFRIDVHHSTSGTANEVGTGLGLILCKELVEKNGGEIWVESNLTGGSTFRFTIPESK